MLNQPLSAADLLRLRSRADTILTGHGVTVEPESTTHEIAADPRAVENDDQMRRAFHRHKTLISGKLVLNDLNSVVDCFVRDLSDSGARIGISAFVPVPNLVGLRLNDGTYHRARVVRRNGLEFGVKFLD